MARVIAFDVETTGLSRYDRIVTLGAVSLENGRIRRDRCLHLIFDPRKDSHPRAIDVHGWDNWTTRFQDLFADHAANIRHWFEWADLIVAHHAAFDMRYLQRELRKADEPPLERPQFCTMEEARARWADDSAKLDTCIARIGLTRASAGGRHGAFEDALLAAQLFQSMHGYAVEKSPFGALPSPSNFRDATPHPGEPLPRRASKRRQMAASDGSSSKPDDLLAAVMPEVIILRSLALADGRAAKHENLAIDAFVDTFLPDTLSEDDQKAAAAKIRKIHPTPHDVESAIAAIAIKDDRAIIAMLSVAKDVIEADGHVDDRERRAFHELCQAILEARRPG